MNESARVIGCITSYHILSQIYHKISFPQYRCVSLGYAHVNEDATRYVFFITAPFKLLTCQNSSRDLPHVIGRLPKLIGATSLHETAHFTGMCQRPEMVGFMNRSICTLYAANGSHSHLRRWVCKCAQPQRVSGGEIRERTVSSLTDVKLAAETLTAS